MQKIPKCCSTDGRMSQDQHLLKAKIWTKFIVYLLRWCQVQLETLMSSYFCRVNLFKFLPFINADPETFSHPWNIAMAIFGYFLHSHTTLICNIHNYINCSVKMIFDLKDEVIFCIRRSTSQSPRPSSPSPSSRVLLLNSPPPRYPVVISNYLLKH